MAIPRPPSRHSSDPLEREAYRLWERGLYVGITLGVIKGFVMVVGGISIAAWVLSHIFG